MKSKSGFLLCALVFLTALSPTGSALAQEGHPMTGTWYGDWGPTPTHRNPITIIMAWDGKAISGTINPGPDAIPITTATLDSTKWMFHLEANTKDQKGAPVHFVADGKLENVTSYNRTVTGSWNHGAVKGDFKLRRD